MVDKYGGSEQEEWEMASVCRFDRFKQLVDATIGHPWISFLNAF